MACGLKSGCLHAYFFDPILPLAPFFLFERIFLDAVIFLKITQIFYLLAGLNPLVFAKAAVIAGALDFP